jgi:hypothetical protein
LNLNASVFGNRGFECRFYTAESLVDRFGIVAVRCDERKPGFAAANYFPLAVL